MRGHRKEIVERHGWNLTRAARALHISVAKLKWWLHKRGIRRPAWSKGYRAKTIQVRSTATGLEKRCRVCQQWLPLQECFNINQGAAMGRDNACKACRHDQRLEIKSRKLRQVRAPRTEAKGRGKDRGPKPRLPICGGAGESSPPEGEACVRESNDSRVDSLPSDLESGKSENSDENSSVISVPSAETGM